MREQVIKTIEETKIIVIVRGVRKEKLIPLAEALYKGGIRLLELTYDACGNVSDADTAKNVRMLCDRFKGEMIIGSGTVLNEQQVNLTKEAGGEFIISPDTNEAVISKTRDSELVSIPGAMTPSEIQRAHSSGADFVKLFPLSSLGADYVKAVSAPLSHIKMLAVGGVSLLNLDEYMLSGAKGIGIGGALTKKELIENNEFDKITQMAESYIEKLSKY